jgi:hypothetical protein
MRTVMYQDEPHEQGSTAFTLAVIVVVCLFVIGLALLLFFTLGSDGGIVSDPFSTYPIHPE